MRRVNDMSTVPQTVEVAMASGNTSCMTTNSNALSINFLLSDGLSHDLPHVVYPHNLSDSSPVDHLPTSCAMSAVSSSSLGQPNCLDARLQYSTAEDLTTSVFQSTGWSGLPGVGQTPSLLSTVYEEAVGLVGPAKLEAGQTAEEPATGCFAIPAGLLLPILPVGGSEIDLDLGKSSAVTSRDVYLSSYPDLRGSASKSSDHPTPDKTATPTANGQTFSHPPPAKPDSSHAASAHGPVQVSPSAELMQRLVICLPPSSVASTTLPASASAGQDHLHLLTLGQSSSAALRPLDGCMSSAGFADPSASSGLAGDPEVRARLGFVDSVVCSTPVYQLAYPTQMLSALATSSLPATGQQTTFGRLVMTSDPVEAAASAAVAPLLMDEGFAGTLLLGPSASLPAQHATDRLGRYGRR
ncbi:unnamed protein product [Protopolystoma xenopodis]|uniref:Uncharacterized protein n=1 Tax=Protopolystoma xenopodis TaxID=117903 RepID=A0A448XC90_9PLAT|nr:unnamed protein product [Protopolystoma xenopodis]